MIETIKKGIGEFDDKNYEKALEYFDAVGSENEFYDFISVYRIRCLMELYRFKEALMITNSLIEQDSYDSLLWFEKVRCHIKLKEKTKALKALNELERLIDLDNKHMNLCLAECYKLLNEYEKALKFCNNALKVDENYIDALQEKAMIASHLKDDDLLNECADKLLELSEGDTISILLPFLLKLFSGRYNDAYNMISKMQDIDLEHTEMLYAAIYNQILEDKDIQIRITGNVDIYIEKAIQLLLAYVYDGVDCGHIKGEKYVILKQEN